MSNTIKYVTFKQVPFKLRATAERIASIMCEDGDICHVDDERDVQGLFWSASEVEGFLRSVGEGDDNEKQQNKEAKALGAWLRKCKVRLFVLDCADKDDVALDSGKE